MKLTGFADLASLPEDERIDVIGRYVIEHGKTVSICIDDQPDKVARYIRKLKEKFPAVAILDQFKGPVAGVVTVKVGPQ